MASGFERDILARVALWKEENSSLKTQNGSLVQRCVCFTSMIMDFIGDAVFPKDRVDELRSAFNAPSNFSKDCASLGSEFAVSQTEVERLKVVFATLEDQRFKTTATRKFFTAGNCIRKQGSVKKTTKPLRRENKHIESEL